MDALISDFLYAFRIFFKRPGLTLLAILALALSLGMTTSTFSTLNGMFFKPLPFKDPGELHHIFLSNAQSEMKMMPIPLDQFHSLRGVEAFEEVMAYYSGTINVSGKGKPQRYDGAFVTANFLDLLGHKPVLGTGFTHRIPGPDSPGEILISHAVWQERYHGDPDVLGESLRANGKMRRIVGVLPEGFHFPSQADAWVPLDEAPNPWDEKQMMHVVAVGRLADDASPESARNALAGLFESWDSAALEKKEDLSLTCMPFGRLEMNRASTSLTIVTVCAVIFILLVSCANVANLLVGRAITRGREMAIRAAIGATRRRILRQLLTESLLLSFFGAVGGLLYAAWAVDYAMESKMWELPYWMNFELDWRVFAFVLFIMLATALVSGLIPAWQASKTDLNEMLKDTSHTSTSFRLGRLTRLLAVVQIAFSCALLFGAGLVARYTLEIAGIEPGFAAEKVISMRMGLFPGDYPDEATRDGFYARLIEEVDKLPGVRKSAVTSWIGQFGNFEEPFLLAGEQADNPRIGYAFLESVSPDYFQTLGMDLLAGRSFTAADNGESGAPVVVVNETFTELHLSGKDPVGQQVNLISSNSMQLPGGPVAATIVGVVPDVRVSNFTKPGKREAIIYTPFTQSASSFMSLVASADGEMTPEIQEAIEAVILRLDPNLPVYFQKTMADFMEEQIRPYAMLANFLLSIGLMALFLAAIGVYGMLAFNVSRRRREIGIRMALGANTRNIVTQVIRQGFVQVVVGLALGTGLAWFVGSIARNFLLGIDPMDTSVYAGVLLTLAGVAALAFFIPARRASRLSPMDALRYE